MTAWTAHVTVATVVEKDGKFLFVEEHTEGVTHTVFNQPAGHV
ncbi:MAG: NUDIX hydrolase, partial [Acinetobacter bohemicus]